MIGETKRFVTIKEACAMTGLSMGFIRKGCRNGTIPCIRIGERGDYRINLPAFLDLLDKQSMEA